MKKAATNHHLFTPCNTGRIRRKLGFQFQYKGTADGEMQGYWAKNGSGVKVQRVRINGNLVWQVTINDQPEWIFIHPDENEIIDTLVFLSDSSQVQKMTSPDPSLLFLK